MLSDKLVLVIFAESAIKAWCWNLHCQNSFLGCHISGHLGWNLWGNYSPRITSMDFSDAIIRVTVEWCLQGNRGPKSHSEWLIPQINSSDTSRLGAKIQCSFWQQLPRKLCWQWMELCGTQIFALIITQINLFGTHYLREFIQGHLGL